MFGKNNTFGHPNREVVKRMEIMNTKVYRTDLMGEITIITNGNKYCTSAMFDSKYKQLLR